MTLSEIGLLALLFIFFGFRVRWDWQRPLSRRACALYRRIPTSRGERLARWVFVAGLVASLGSAILIFIRKALDWPSNLFDVAIIALVVSLGITFLAEGTAVYIAQANSRPPPRTDRRRVDSQVPVREIYSR